MSAPQSIAACETPQDLADFLVDLAKDYDEVLDVCIRLRTENESLHLEIDDIRREFDVLDAENDALKTGIIALEAPGKRKPNAGLTPSPFRETLRALQPGESHFEPCVEGGHPRDITKKMANTMQHLGGGRLYAVRVVTEGGILGGRVYRLG